MDKELEKIRTHPKSFMKILLIIKEASETGHTIMVPDEKQKAFVIKIAKEFKWPIKEPFVWH